MDLGIIKNDVVTELRSQRYFNEQEITRLVQANSNHKTRILAIARLTRDNANIIDALQLLEVYFPAAQPQPASSPAAQSLSDQQPA